MMSRIEIRHAISKNEFRFMVKADPGFTPQAYACMPGIWPPGPTQRLSEKTFLRWLVVILALINAVNGIVLSRPGTVLADGSDWTSQDIAGYILKKSTSNDIVFLGDDHKNTGIMTTVSGLIDRLHQAGVTHLALEIASDQQPAIDRYLATGEGLDEIKIHTQFVREQYRDLFKMLRSIDVTGRVPPIAIDLPEVNYRHAESRDAYMANCLASIYESAPRAKILVVVGNYHVLKKFHWKEPAISDRHSIREYLSHKNPTLNMFSIFQVARKPPAPCDFYTTFHAVRGAVAIDLNPRFCGWRLGMLSSLAVNSPETCELLDAVIVY